jgi:hypothetical protein
MYRNEAITAIKTALKARSKKTWSVTGGRGTAYGWITIDVPPSRRNFDADGNPGGFYMSAEDNAELKKLLGLSSVHHQGVSIPASNQHYAEYIARANGKKPAVIAQPYWD